MESLKVVFVVFIMCATAVLHAADTTMHVTLIKNLDGAFQNFYTDNLGNIFTVSTTNQIKKYSSNADSVGVFNDVKQYGSIYSLNVTNPLKLLVFYKDFGTIVLLDRFLTTLAKIDLRSKGFMQVKAVSLSYDSNIWLYDELENKLKKIDNNGNLLFESTDFRLLFNELPHPSKIMDDNGQLYLYDAAAGWYIFDYYGALKTKLAFTNWQDVAVKDGTLYGRKQDMLYSYNPRQLRLDSAKIDLPFNTIIKVQQQPAKLFVLEKTGLGIYNITQ